MPKKIKRMIIAPIAEKLGLSKNKEVKFDSILKCEGIPLRSFDLDKITKNKGKKG